MKKKSVARIKDIAEKAKVSAGTVDRVLHNRGRVSKEVKERVLAIVKELNYEPNILAQTLVSNRNYRLAALVPDPKVDEYWEAPLRGIEKAERDFRQFGLEVVQFIYDPFNVKSFKNIASKLDDNSIDGILLAPIFSQESLHFMSKWKKAGIPFNLFNTHIPDFEPLVYIGQDSYQSGILAGKMLHYGHPSPTTFMVVHIDEDLKNSPHLLKKEQGFYDYFQQDDCKSFQIITAELKERDNKAIFHQQLEQQLNCFPQTTGIFVTNSRAFYIASFLEEKGIENIRLIGYDLLEKNKQYLEKGIISFIINQNPFSQGFLGIELLLNFLIFKKRPDPIKYLSLDLITRENLIYYSNKTYLHNER
jgi:LacI family transcriptional regulator